MITFRVSSVVATRMEKGSIFHVSLAGGFAGSMKVMDLKPSDDGGYWVDVEFYEGLSKVATNRLLNAIARGKAPHYESPEEAMNKLGDFLNQRFADQQDEWWGLPISDILINLIIELTEERDKYKEALQLIRQRGDVFDELLNVVRDVIK